MINSDLFTVGDFVILNPNYKGNKNASNLTYGKVYTITTIPKPPTDMSVYVVDDSDKECIYWWKRFNRCDKDGNLTE